MNPTSSATQSIGEHLASHRQGSLQVFTIERESEGNQLTLGMISASFGQWDGVPGGAQVEQIDEAALSQRVAGASVLRAPCKPCLTRCWFTGPSLGNI